MNIKHIYTKPYQPQANGKIERFWKTLHEDFVDGSLFENVADLENELLALMSIIMNIAHTLQLVEWHPSKKAKPEG